MRLRAPISLYWKLLLSTSVAITILFGFTGWLVQKHAVDTIDRMLEDEVSASLRVYETLWESRAHNLKAISRVLSSMSDVRAAFGTGDGATIRDTAGDLWARVSDSDAVFLVTDPQGRVIASLGGAAGQSVEGQLRFVDSVRSRFPDQVSGFVFLRDRLYQMSVTPVYVESSPDPVLLNVLVAGYPIDKKIADQLKLSTGGSDFVFVSGNRVLASSMSSTGERYPSVTATSELLDLNGKAIGELRILRSLERAGHEIATLRRNIFLIYLVALIAGLLLTAMLAKRIVEPVQALDRAAAEVARQNYQYRVEARGQDEIGRLGATFNSMCDSIQSARAELIRQERIATIGQLSTSIVHDLRNPLAAIYGGAEMLVDGDLPPAQVKRLAANIYRASRNIQELLQELSDISSGKTDRTELCHLREVILAGFEPIRALAETAKVTVKIRVPDDLEVPLARARMERVFSNLLVNSVQAMRAGGAVEVSARRDDHSILVDITDNGPGIPSEIRDRLFQPFVTEGKKNGLGLGLALSRQTVLNHGGDLWLAGGTSQGAHFQMRLAL